MAQSINRGLTARRISLRHPVVLVIAAAIAVPIELRPWGRIASAPSFEPRDFIENVIGFLPVGIVLADLGLARALLWSLLLSAGAETAQFSMAHRDPSAFDVLANVVGAGVGAFAWRAVSSRSPVIPLSHWTAAASLAGAVAMTVMIWSSAGAPYNPRGVTEPGTLEAHWRFDEKSGRTAEDSSGHALGMELHRNVAVRRPGVLGNAIRFDSAGDYAVTPVAQTLRLEGSMTVTAWVQSSSFPFDDAAIVSQLGNGFGYQLDTTVDKGPRTIGFKLTNSCGDMMARYGATPLATGNWDHVAGVYDAAHRTLDVYRNGKPDNGPLEGEVTSSQRSSRYRVFLGRRADQMGFAFAGLLDDVRIYSFALSARQIEVVMAGGDITDPPQSIAPIPSSLQASCAVQSEPDDARAPVSAALFGVLIAIALSGIWPRCPWIVRAVLCAVAGFVFLPLMPTLPLLGRWIMPAASIAGSVSVFVSIREDR